MSYLTHSIHLTCLCVGGHIKFCLKKRLFFFLSNRSEYCVSRSDSKSHPPAYIGYVSEWCVFKSRRRCGILSSIGHQCVKYTLSIAFYTAKASAFEGFQQYKLSGNVFEGVRYVSPLIHIGTNPLPPWLGIQLRYLAGELGPI
jgi:hypothetical protein